MVQGSLSKITSGSPSTFEEAKSRAQSARKGRTRVRSTMSRACFKDLFVLGERLGGGAYASVYSCWRRHPLTEEEKRQEFAVKVIDKIPTHSRQRCLNEVELFFKCRSNKHIIRVEETFDEEDAFYIIFEKVHGGPLMNAIARCETITEREVVQVVQQLADAIAFLHNINIAHRDLKPDNILCVSQDSISPVKLCDLDLGSKVEINHSRCGMTPQLLTPVGSAEYMAPEVVEGFVSDDASPYDKRCDLWSLGVVIYILLCGYPPFCGNCGEDCGWAQGGSCVDCQNQLFGNIQEGNFSFPEQDWDKVDPLAKDLVRKLLVKDPKQRLSAQMILDHPWIKSGGSDTILNTPQNINKTSFGTEKVSNFASSAMEVNSLVMQHMHIDYDSEGSSESDDTVYGTSPPACGEFGATPPSPHHLRDRYSDPGFVGEEGPFGLSPPTASRLLQRRSQERRRGQSSLVGSPFIPQLAH
ncbi:hypothetical protein HAZT_HAZT010289 [Hyalella azteca]|uniref:MAP kinase-interacting serine/threonine-protein kinase 1 n=1 Tax=Hyalella azteca TaxID=294128 RepID=A0A6A0H7F9_HYAAZ|nr:MAP kinase-interacting serine/threonine-protein kinase 1 [Hyalella azteca]KAA0200300.1 hypothetical protein HAZT_HAZT010289 [Hyalella azteca]